MTDKNLMLTASKAASLVTTVVNYSISLGYVQKLQINEPLALLVCCHASSYLPALSNKVDISRESVKFTNIMLEQIGLRRYG